MKAEIATAAHWWTDQLRNPPKGNLSDHTGAEHDPSVELMHAIGTTMYNPTPEAIALFQVSLERVLRERIDNWPVDLGLAFGTDYGPDPELSEALDCAGLNRHSML